MKRNTMDKFVIWSEEILELLKDSNPKDKIVVYLGYPINCYFPITGAEDSQSIGWWEIRFDPNERIYNTITVETLLANLPKGFMVMLQERCHSGKSYPITRAFKSRDGYIIACDDSDLEYWDELEKWKIEQDENRIKSSE
jgi:hypothetical protein